MRQEEIKYILVADSHLSGDDSDPAADGFFAMLDRIASFILETSKLYLTFEAKIITLPDMLIKICRGNI